MDFSYITDNQKRFIDELTEFLRIPSISTLPEYKESVQQAAEWTASRLQHAGIEHVKVMETNGHPIVYGDWLHAEGAPTVLFYGHYDVQPAEPLDLWNSQPFEPVIENERIYARGATDMKANVLLPVIACETWLKDANTLPVNVKFLFEGEEEIGSPSLAGFMEENKELLRADAAISADSGRMEEDQPASMVSLRGLAGVQIDVRSAGGDLHSGLYGGAVPNSAQALARILDSLKHEDGTVAVEGFYDDVMERSDEEKETINATFSSDETFQQKAGVDRVYGEPGYTPGEQTLIRPTLDINGLWGGYQGIGVKTVIPAESHAKVTCRLVPNQDPEHVIDLIRRHVERHTPAEVDALVFPLEGKAYPYMLPEDHPGLKAVEEAVQHVEEKSPHQLRIGGSIPVAGLLQQLLDVHTVQLGYSVFDEGMHAPNEFYRLSQFEKGQKVYTRLLQELAEYLE
ncbi:dipeptidase [Salibacterium qingdaonense]|uniref:Acetylornithine deacetylase/Succinyl-diaminopimelate desuccinylase n=1 Tax=Salibacterium qingdaonense TaxID=266892 RepID=A0A1I4MCN3_9BACI|nr:dipeptidase [Salibacterium qingdaonense]SFM00775.1 Acetylornithine deacetylase/Succinyl-diaminopimelate desuccinylase [Salibacterium qingdaonense]